MDMASFLMIIPVISCRSDLLLISHMFKMISCNIDHLSHCVSEGRTIISEVPRTRDLLLLVSVVKDALLRNVMWVRLLTHIGKNITTYYIGMLVVIACVVINTLRKLSTG